MECPILDSELTWSDLQQKCFEVFGQGAVFGANRTVKDIGEGKGNVARCCLIDPDWTLQPEKFLTKICLIPKDDSGKDTDYAATTRKVMGEVGKHPLQIHNVECTIYKLLTKYKNKEILIPKIYSVVAYSEKNTHKGYIIMEHVNDAVTLNVWDNLTLDELKQALRLIAALQAVSLQFTQEEKQTLSYNPLYDIFKQVKNPNSDKSKTTVSSSNGFNDFVRDTPVWQTSREYIRILPDIYDLDFMYANMGKELGILPVLVHADAWSTNFLWRKTDEGLKLVSVLDFQTSYLGMPGGDVMRVMSTFLSHKDRKEHWNELIEYFYNTFLSMIGDMPAPYKLDQLHENIRRYYPMVRLAFAIPQSFWKKESSFDEETKKKVKDVLLEKMRGIMEDTVFYHERNNRLKQK